MRLPPRPGPRRLPARLAAVALPRPSWPKSLLTSFQQTQSRSRSARQLVSRAALLIFGMACSSLGRAQGRSLLPEAPAPKGIALLSGAQQIFGSPASHKTPDSVRNQYFYPKHLAPGERRGMFQSGDQPQPVSPYCLVVRALLGTGILSFESLSAGDSSPVRRDSFAAFRYGPSRLQPRRPRRARSALRRST